MERWTPVAAGGLPYPHTTAPSSTAEIIVIYSIEKVLEVK